MTYWKKLKEEQTTIETLLALNLRKKGKQLPDGSNKKINNRIKKAFP